MNCKNCQTELQEQDDYCLKCGGKVIRNRLTLKNLFTHLSETFFNYDNKLLRTIVSLITKPETVISSYVEGVRKRFVNPISFFGLSLTLAGISIFLIKKFYLEYFDLQAWMMNLEIFSNEAAQQALANYSTSDSMEYSSLIFSAIIPVFALLSWIVFYDKKYNLTEHIVIYLYSMSLYSILSIIIGQLILLIIPNYYISFVFLSYPVILLYHCFLLKRLFKLSFSETILKTFLFLVLFIICYIIFGIISFVIGLITGTFDLNNFKPKSS
ncbi:DUF3667 domain-containing protein [Winogradskyella echinorum]|uniref:DUF3667 domain-containing protein n=1 Tax=Winogradskyella echinorum TaxID=538189 RepID=A0ABR6XWZ4_9FLAO|nr:DUF3667 domain-containing protein [Winogradskyella echinorum]MBC3844993.1 DUF3667 domain-containing protein [Winogradskyella echinorum]MBC5749341.1 DUF3667 domain-containing protein [Winogradskyella echinorum]